VGLATGIRRNHTGGRTLALLGMILLLAVTLSPAYAQADVVAEHTYTYSQTATFTLTFPPGTAPDTATLYVKVGTYTKAYPIPVVEDMAQLERNLSEEPFPPFTMITYWWEYKDAQGETLSTEKQQFLYEDNRFAWETLSEGAITLHWVAGDKVLMNNALDIAHSALVEIQERLTEPDVDSVPIVDSVTLYIYPSLPDLQSALQLTGYEWVGGQAYPEIGVVLLAISPSSEAILKMKRDIPHELTHKVLYDLTGPQGYAALPIWLVEGLASVFERSPDPAYALALQRAAQDGTLIPMTTLCHPFPAETNRALLAYAQSQSFVRYLQQTYGWSQMREIIDAYADGMDCSAGVKQKLGADLTTLEREWRVWLEQQNPDSAVSATWTYVTTIVRDLAPWLVLMGLLCVPACFLWVGTALKPH